MAGSTPHPNPEIGTEYTATVDGKKRRIHKEFLTYHRLLEIKENQVCRELDAICLTESERFQGTLHSADDEIRMLSTRIEDLQASFQQRNMLQRAEYYLTGLQQVLEERQQLESSPPILSIKMRFGAHTAELLDATCEIEQVKLFRYDPYPESYRPKQTPNESIEAITIDFELKCIFAIVKSTVSSIRVYNTHNLDEEVVFSDQKIMFPNNLAVAADFLFVVCDRSILRLSKRPISVLSIVNSSVTLSGIAVNYSNPCLYLGVAERLVINVYSLELDQIKSLQLKTTEESKHRKHTRMQHLYILHEELYILFTNTNHPLQAYSLEGEVLRCIISESLLKEGRRFSFDSHLNIFITDREAHQLKIFSNEGILLHRIGQEGTALGRFMYPCGLAVDENGSVYVTDGKDSALMQKFVVKPYL